MSAVSQLSSLMTQGNRRRSEIARRIVRRPWFRMTGREARMIQKAMERMMFVMHRKARKWRAIADALEEAGR